MTDRRLRAATVALAVGGAAIAAYLSYTRLTDSSIICPTSGCATVQRSSYSELFGVPVAYLGVLGYLAIAAAASAPRRPFGLPAAVTLTVVAAATGAYLLVAQLALIHATCVWCLASDAVLTCLVAVAALRCREDRPRDPIRPASGRERARRAEFRKT